MTAAEVKAALHRRHGAETGRGDWVTVEEAFCGWATAGGGIDLWALGVWQTAKAGGLPGAGRAYTRPGETEPVWDARNPIVAYEVKVSRSDYRREVYGYEPGPNANPYKTKRVPPWPLKASWALERSHYFMFAVPKGLLAAEEIEQREKPADTRKLWLPPEAGLIEVDDAGCHVRVEAPRRPAPPRLSRHEVGELLRHVSKPNKKRRALAEVARLRGDVDRLLRENGRLRDLIEGRAAA